MRVLVTGATGFIGRSLVPYLVSKQEIDVTVLLREKYLDTSTLPPPLITCRPYYTFIYADLRNFRMTSQAIRESEPDCVIHLAAAGVTDPFLNINTAVRHNVSGTINLLRACFETNNRAQQLIIGRTPGELSAMNVYAASKAAAWNFCQMYGRTQQWPIQGAMIFQAYGSGQPYHTLIPAAISAALAGQDFPMTAGTQARDWIHISDVVTGISKMIGAALSPGTSIDLGTGDLTSVADVVRSIYAFVDGEGKPRIGALPNRPGEELQQRADSNRTRALIGWEASIDLQEGLGQLVAQQIIQKKRSR